MSKYTPKPDELKKRASLFWPKELLAKEESASVIPLLVGTQEKFISILDVSERSPDSWKNVLHETKGMQANLFLKHLMVLADIGGEPLMRLHHELASIFPGGKLIFAWHEKPHIYTFKEILKRRKLDNKSLFVDGKSLVVGHELDDGIENVIMLLLFGAAASINRVRASAMATRLVSIVIQRRPHCSATYAVVPLPHVGSRTRSPSILLAFLFI